MPHFAELNASDIVIRVIVAPDQSWCETELGGKWVVTSYTGSIRGKLAGIGDTYNADHDVFIIPIPHSSWTYDFMSHKWTPPVEYPQEGGIYLWDESTLTWTAVESSQVMP